MKTLKEEFQVKEEKKNFEIVKDYNIFKDKDLLDKLRNEIIQNLIDNKIPDDDSFTEYVNNQIDKSLEGYDLSNLERNHIYNLIDNEINGYGPITELLKDRNVTEIMVNGPDQVYVEIDGVLAKDDTISFINKDHILRTIQRIVQPLGRTIDASSPMVDSRLPDGSRINAVIPPLSIKGPILTIRKFKENMSSVEDLIRNGTMTPYMARFLDACVKAKANIIVSGGTGSGKTTLLNILSSFIPEDERIITIEDAAELTLKQKHVIPLETRKTNYKSDTEVTVRDLVRNSLRMRPDRIIVGEVRGGEAFDMLQAMNTGHEGSITSLHSNSPQDALNRLETMVLMSGIEIPVRAIREYIENAIEIIIHIERLADGRRKVVKISEVICMDNNEIQIKDIFEFKKNGMTSNKEVNGEFILYDYVPKIYQKMKERGIDTVDDMFEEFIKKEGE